MRLFDVNQHTLRWRVLALLTIVAVHVAIFILLHSWFWDGTNGFLGWDAVRQAWGDLVAVKHSLGAGELPLWSPYEKMGYPIAFDPEVGHLYPLHWLLYLLMTFFGEGYWIVLVKALLHYGVAAMGMHLYLARYGLPSSARWFGSFSYILNSRLAKSKDQAALGTVVWLPLMLLSVDETIKKKDWRSGVLLGTVVGVDLLAAYPPNFIRNTIILLPYFIVQLVLHLRRTYAWKEELVAIVKSVSVAICVAVGLGLPSMISITGFAESFRTTMSMAEVMRSTLRLADTLQLIVPSLRTQGNQVGFYMGFLTFVLAVYALFNAKRRIRLLWAALFILSFLFSMGKNTFVLPLMVKAFGPVFSSWRVPEQYLFLPAFFMSALAALGFASLTNREGGSKRLKASTIAALGAGLAVIAFVVASLVRNPKAARIESALSSLVIASVAFGLLLAIERGIRGRSGKNGAFLGLIILLLFDFFVLLQPIYNIRQPPPIVVNDGRLDDIPRARQQARIADYGYFDYRVGLRNNVREFFGRATALVTKRYMRYQRAARRSPKLLLAANVEYVTGRGQDAVLRDKTIGHHRISPGIIQLHHAAPRAYWTDTLDVVINKQAALRWLQRNPVGVAAVFEKGDLLSRQAERESVRREIAKLLKKPTPIMTREAIAERTHRRVVAAQLLDGKFNSLAVEIVAPRAGVVVFNEAYHREWRAQVDGKAATVFRLNYLFRGVFVPKGRHRVKLFFRPKSYLMGLAVYSLTLTALLGIALFALVRKWRQR